MTAATLRPTAEEFRAAETAQEHLISSTARAIVYGRSSVDMVNLSVTEWDLLLAAVADHLRAPSTETYVRNARQSGASWRDVGAALGIPHTTAHGRFRHVDHSPAVTR